MAGNSTRKFSAKDFFNTRDILHMSFTIYSLHTAQFSESKTVWRLRSQHCFLGGDERNPYSCFKDDEPYPHRWWTLSICDEPYPCVCSKAPLEVKIGGNVAASLLRCYCVRPHFFLGFLVRALLIHPRDWSHVSTWLCLFLLTMRCIHVGPNS